SRSAMIMSSGRKPASRMLAAWARTERSSSADTPEPSRASVSRTSSISALTFEQETLRGRNAVSGGARWRMSGTPLVDARVGALSVHVGTGRGTPTVAPVGGEAAHETTHDTTDSPASETLSLTFGTPQPLDFRTMPSATSAGGK